MVSAERAASNAANALLSTGPKTEEGKARVSQNARKHGLTARDLVVPVDQREEFDQLLAEHTQELKPVGIVEQTIFNQLVRAAWDLRRIGQMQAAQSQEGKDPLTDEAKRAEVDRLERYHQRAERSYYRALREFRATQTNRALREVLDEGYRNDIPEMANVTQVTKQLQRNWVLEDAACRLAQEIRKILPTIIQYSVPVQNKPNAVPIVRK